ncbi:MAG: response regulator, partial [Polyangiaceae bacterium]
VALSAFTTAEAVAEARAAGFEGHVAKPVVLLELLDAVHGATQTRPQPESGRPPERSVLIVEDDRAIADELRDILHERGFTVKVAHDGATAWAILHEGGYHPNVILLDIVMPVMDGWTLRRKLLEEESLAAIPVVVVTGTQTNDLSEIERVEAIVRKPFDVRALLSALGPAGERRLSRGGDAE